MKFSIYVKNFKESKYEWTLNDVIDYITLSPKVGKIEKSVKLLDSLLTEQYEEYLQNGDKQTYNDTKLSNLPAITWAGRFTRSVRSKNNCEDYSEFINIDIDGLTKEELQVKRELLLKDKYTHILFISPSKHGIKLVVKVFYPTKTKISKLDFYEKSYEILSNYYKENYDLEIDPSCKDISRLCFLPYDPDLYYNSTSEIYMTIDEMNVNQKQKLKIINKSSTIPELINQFLTECKNKTIIFDYNEWLSLSFILYRELGQYGLEVYKEFSKIDVNKYNEKKTEKQWNICIKSFDNNRSPSIKRLVNIMINKGIYIDEKIIKNYKYDDNDLPYLINELIGKCYINEVDSQIYIMDNNELIRVDDPIWNSKFESIKLYHKTCYEPILRKYFYNSNNIVKFNPLINMLEKIKSNDNSEFNKLNDYFSFLDDDKVVDKIKYFMIGSISNMTSSSDYFDNFLIFKGNQSSGKTYFIRDEMLSIFSDYTTQHFNYSESVDDRKTLCSNAFILNDESTFTTKIDAKRVKLLSSLRNVDYIDKYQTFTTSRKRIATFIGTTNSEIIYNDETGGRRFIIINLENNYLPGSIYKGKEMRKKFELDWSKIWGYIYYLWKDEGIRHRNLDSDFGGVEEYGYKTGLEKLLIEYFEKCDNFYKYIDIRQWVRDIAEKNGYQIKLDDGTRELSNCLINTLKGQKQYRRDGNYYNIRLKSMSKNNYYGLDLVATSQSLNDILDKICENNYEISEEDREKIKKIIEKEDKNDLF